MSFCNNFGRCDIFVTGLYLILYNDNQSINRKYTHVELALTYFYN